MSESKQIQLSMLLEIDAFCREHNIKYSLSCGTLIGAIRHEGYIPWDDDVDITMPWDEMIRFKELFYSENLSYIDLDMCNKYEFPFSRVVHKKSYSKKGIMSKSYGLCIDIYPIIKCSSDRRKLKKIIEQGYKINIRRRFYLKWEARLNKILPRCILLPGSYKAKKRYKDFFINSLANSGKGMFYQIGGTLDIFFKNAWDFDPFENLVDVDFEGHKFRAVRNYDTFLKVRYGDYMKLPPKEQRIPYHGQKYYWK